MSDSPELDAVRCWVGKTVVGLNLCPFAAAPMKGDRIRYRLCQAENPEGIYRELLEEMELLVGLPEATAETSLFVVPRGLAEFGEYLDLFATADAVIPEAGLDGILQLASFHPDYCFEGALPDDPANYTNRAPYPMFHLIREAPLARALEHYPAPEGIPERNVALLRELGLSAMQQRLAACLEGDAG
ncbi:MAG: DUF1415 domain-containing protein [Candidatus Thiodiazotropha sp. (ex Gloverina cf. vestifex)]|nr:DUF1415 domain-containing protein [Candidatus Thiodiazotropha sp. (ex Gloverina cf. vestifex)]